MDEHGVGRLVEMGTTAGKEANPSLEVGVCGEHGGDPASIALCHRIGLDYVSASPPASRWPGWPRPGSPWRRGFGRLGMSPVTQVPPAPVDRGALLQALEPLGRSRTLPAEAYLSPDLFTWEIDHIFTGSWLCLGRVDGLVETGQARALSAGRPGCCWSAMPAASCAGSTTPAGTVAMSCSPRVSPRRCVSCAAHTTPGPTGSTVRCSAPRSPACPVSIRVSTP